MVLSLICGLFREYISTGQEWTNEDVENEMDLIVSAVRSLRSLAKESRERRPGYVLPRNAAVAETINKRKLEIVTLANLSSLTVINDNDAAPVGCAVSVVNENLSVYLQFQGAISAEAELEKINKKMDEIKKQQEKLKKMMDASGYKEKVRPQIHEENVNKLASLMQELLSLEEAGLHIKAHR